MIQWSRELVEQCIEIEKFARSPNEARASIEEALGITLTQGALRDAHARYGFPPPLSFIGTKARDTEPVMGAPVADLDWDSDSDTVSNETIADRRCVDFSAPSPEPPRAALDMRGRVERLVLWGDTHGPYHSEYAFALGEAVVQTFKPHRLVTMGDFGDFYCTSRHPKNPERSRDLSWEVSETAKLLDRLDRLGVERKHFLFGNHSANLANYLWEKAPELFNVVKVEELFKLKERGWTWTPYREYTNVGHLYLMHDKKYAGRDAHIRTAAAMGTNIAIGHTHRLSINYSSTAIGGAHVNCMVGWLGDPVKAEYMYRVDTKDWQHGLVLGWHEVDTGVVHLQAVPFVKNKCVVNGELLAA